ncbi:iron-containing alcohol dehydrogenase [Musicola paradisiaca]|uniref:Iron-containing alcohol dehydrogenase n=1 Tax=Musicola paradisiaca (strain Ech703) TaxID=579405 RepID=C6CDD2_MUSP7|nr:iron-containing alcohol dehydrogenase [Musicola paradisiaca]ACS87003.1 iron-containing alcohol dehydrogenase [Musicola paradisiaca Ech703]
MKFTYVQPVRLCFGRGEAQRVGQEVAALGKRVLLVTGKTSCRKTGLLDRLTGWLAQSGVGWTLFDRIESNPLTTTVDEGARLARVQQCDVVLGVGGGSVMDAAKGIAFMACNGGSILDYLAQPEPQGGALPLVLMTTTAGTGSEGNCVAVFTNPDTHDKPVFFTPALFARTSIIDPELMVTQSPAMVASTGFDALSHNIEARVGNFCQPMTEIMTERAIGLLATFLPRVCRDVTDLDAWDRVCWANTLGGMSIGLSACGLPHAMEHPLSGLYNITHGEGLAALYPELMRFSWRDNIPGFAAVARAMSSEASGLGETEQACHSIDLVRRLLHNIGLTFTLRDLGVKEQDIPWMADNCVQTMGVSLAQNPRAATRDDIDMLYRTCL